MATNLSTGTTVNVGELNACVLRVARLNADCHPTGGVDSGAVSAGIVTMTAAPDVEQGQVFEPKNGCGSIMYTLRQEDRIKRYNLSGDLLFFDYEMLSLVFGSTTILGAAAGWAAGKVIGIADRLFSAAPRNGIYLEVIRQIVTTDGGDCVQTTGTVGPAAAGHIFGKCRLIPGQITFENDVAKVPFTGYAENNNWLTNGPWNDFPGAGYVPNSPHVEVQYSQAQYNTILGTVQPGFQTLPVGS